MWVWVFSVNTRLPFCNRWYSSLVSDSNASNAQCTADFPWLVLLLDDIMMTLGREETAITVGHCRQSARYLLLSFHLEEDCSNMKSQKILIMFQRNGGAIVLVAWYVPQTHMCSNEGRWCNRYWQLWNLSSKCWHCWWSSKKLRHDFGLYLVEMVSGFAVCKDGMRGSLLY